MALSYYSNWVSASQPLLSSPDSFPLPMELQPELHQFSTVAAPWTTADPLFHANDFYPANSSPAHYDCLPAGNTTSYDGYTSLAPDNVFLHQNTDPNPKRHKASDYEEFYPEFPPTYFNAFAPNSTPNFPNYEIPVPPLPDFPTGPPTYSYGTYETTMKKEPASSTGSLSAQSLAARLRRRKITEKTQELGKLVPGGQKMNTAEMLQAAFKYIKYLQAQVGVLELMGSYAQEQEEQQQQEEDHDEQSFASDAKLPHLLQSQLIQEKLYSTEKCLVPHKFVNKLSDDHQIVQSNPALLEFLTKQEERSCST